MDPPLSPVSLSYPMNKETWRHTIILSFQSLGVVYGRLSTAPLYVFGSIDAKDVKSKEEIYELFSFAFWTLTIIPLLKYALIVLKADDQGEGGTFALYSLLCRHAKVGLLPSDKTAAETMHHEEIPSKIKMRTRARWAIENHKSCHYFLLLLALVGSCLIICDGVLTPSISVLSATTTLKRSISKILHESASSEKADSTDKYLTKYIPVPTACAILVCLFTLQKYGTHKIGFLFAPVVIIWIVFISTMGIYNISRYPSILRSVSPVYIVRFIRNADITSWKLLGRIVLCIAGSEAMFADLGHFSKKSIQVTFALIIYPVLIICYAGQAAFISNHLGVTPYVTHLSESLPISRDLHHVFTVLSLIASLVGSQATITASFSIINQCQALGCFPRVKVIHTSDKIYGQVYIPDVTWILMVLSLGVTFGLGDITTIANATGLTVICGMSVTSCLMSLVIALYWDKSLFFSVCFVLAFGSVEAMYLFSSLMNFSKGTWCVLVLTSLFLMTMLSWHYGTVKKYAFDVENKVAVDWLTDLSPGLGVNRVQGIGFIYTEIVTGIPSFFSHFVTNLPAFHELLVFVSFKPLPVPYIPQSKRYLIGRVGHKEYKIYRCIVRYGYCDHMRDTHDFEEHIISSIGEFIAREEQEDEDQEAMAEGRMIALGGPSTSAALIPVTEIEENEVSQTSADIESQRSPLIDSYPPVKRKKVRFFLPPTSPKVNPAVRRELQELVDARERGTAYFLGKPHLSVRKGSNFFKRFLIMNYIFLDKNCREPPVALNIPHAALLEVGMAYIV
ncbi:potassium transporter 10-like isoform X1 [Ipomoea triloba]|uniref:potassium transporter 10-like isoform X1 n=1 Tax=Ipomoea triloba TaxID=35885 RepID=UPI00125D0D4F|nr:potassium transporter 10-like isoform X1 [Ipomoea triloba]XP_031090457.1 potassium transporter 10-like isoform X1 [Ipomoea triloba]